MNLHYARRNFVKLGAAAGSALLVPKWVAAQTALLPTEPQIEGPFFPPDVPRTPSDFTLDRDNDLTWVNGKLAFALGTIFEQACGLSRTHTPPALQDQKRNVSRFVDHPNVHRR